MNKLYKPIFIFCTSITLLALNSCDLLEQLFINLKLKEEFTAEGNGPDISDTQDGCLSDDDAYDDYKDDIKSITYVAMAYYSVAFTPGLTGTNISATISNGCTDVPLFQVFLPTAVAADFLNDPYAFELTQDQIDIFNQFLADYQTCDCFTAVLLVEQVSANSGPPYFLEGVVEIVVEIEAQI